jgi:hypothetical protein
VDIADPGVPAASSGQKASNGMGASFTSGGKVCVLDVCCVLGVNDCGYARHALHGTYIRRQRQRMTQKQRMTFMLECSTTENGAVILPSHEPVNGQLTCDTYDKISVNKHLVR